MLVNAISQRLLRGVCKLFVVFGTAGRLGLVPKGTGPELGLIGSMSAVLPDITSMSFRILDMLLFIAVKYYSKMCRCSINTLVETITRYYLQRNFMLKFTFERVKSMFQLFEKPQTYGSTLEAYIVSKNPQCSCDIDRITREYDQKQFNRINSGWTL
jgi:hypothetical protein